jgi:hypothetical protein
MSTGSLILETLFFWFPVLMMVTSTVTGGGVAGSFWKVMMRFIFVKVWNLKNDCLRAPFFSPLFNGLPPHRLRRLG